MTVSGNRLGGYALIVGSVVASLAYVAAGTLVHGQGDARYLDPLWTPLNGIAVGADILIVLGLPVLLASHRRRGARLTLIGYVGLVATMVMLNIAEGCVEAFVKPYLAAHDGVPTAAPVGFAVFEDVALVCLVVGLICLGIGVIRAGVFARWTGVLLIASPIAAFLPLPGPLAELSDYLAFAALVGIGIKVVRTTSRPPATDPRRVLAPDAA